MTPAAQDRIAIGGIAALTLALETALAERKFGIFTGGFGATKVLDAPLELLAFGFGAILCQLLLVALGFLAIRALHRRGAKPALIRLDFAALVGGGLIAWTIAKFEVLSYFSDAISFRLIANLGGGSLFDAFLFALSEGGLMIAGAAGGVVAWLLARWWLARRAQIGGERLKLRRPLIVLTLAIPLAIAAAGRLPDTRYALNRLTAPGLATATLAQLTDVDRDGYSWYSAQLDRHPFDAARHPFALDIPGNGVDEDGFGGDFVYTGSDPITPTPQLPRPRKHLVIIVLESTRADVIGKRINGREVTPNLNALAAAGSRWPFAYSHVGFTTASLKSLFSGQLDPAPGSASLFRDLKANGYRIGVYSGQPEDFGDISATVGMRRAADVYVDAETLKDERAFSFAAQGSLLLDEGKLLREFDRRMGRADDWRRPHFLYFNFQSAHFPYHHPGMSDPLGIVPLERGAISAANARRVAETYYNAVAYADARIGQVIARLKALGVWQDTVLAVTGDHGEALFEGGVLGHGHVLDPAQTQVPFVVSLPGLSSPQPLGLKDMRAILLEALGGPAAPPRTRPTFLHIGPLDAPAAIGMVSAGGVFTTMALETEEVWLSGPREGGPRARYETLTGAARTRADALVNEWARQRWQRHLTAR